MSARSVARAILAGAAIRHLSNLDARLLPIHLALANFAAGFVAQWVGRIERLVGIGAVLLFAYFAYNHWWALWGVMPDWYNVLVVIPVVPMVWFGSLLARR